MANSLKIRRSAVPGKVPTVGQLVLGEIALNTYDGKMFFKKDVLGVESVVEVGSVTSVSVSGGTTGLLFVGSPITSSGSATLVGTLGVSNGGTGATNQSGARAGLGLAIGTDVQAFHAFLAGLTGLSSNGIVVRTGAGTAASRVVTAGSGLSVENGDGVAGDPAVSLTGVAGELNTATTGVGTGTLDVVRFMDLGTAAFADLEMLTGLYPMVQNSNYQILPQDSRRLILCTSGTRTWTLPVSLDVPIGWTTFIKNRSGAVLTLLASGSDTIDNGLSSVTVADGQAVRAVNTGDTTWEMLT